MDLAGNAVNEEEARQRLADSDATWGKRYPPIAGTRQRAWSEFVPFLGLPDAIRQAVCATNASERQQERAGVSEADSRPRQVNAG